MCFVINVVNIEIEDNFARASSMRQATRGKPVCLPTMCTKHVLAELTSLQLQATAKAAGKSTSRTARKRPLPDSNRVEDVTVRPAKYLDDLVVQGNWIVPAESAIPQLAPLTDASTAAIIPHNQALARSGSSTSVSSSSTKGTTKQTGLSLYMSESVTLSLVASSLLLILFVMDGYHLHICTCNNHVINDKINIKVFSV